MSVENEILKALDVLFQGGVILYPTDTVWGLGCDASNPDAIERLYQIKERDKDKPLLVLLDDMEKLKDYFLHIPPVAYSLMRTVSKPLTIIYPHARNLPANLIARDGSLGMRIVNHPFCTPLIQRLGHPLTSTSANFAGEPAPASFNEINPELIQLVDYTVNPELFPVSQNTPSAIYKILNDEKIICIRE